MRAILAVVAVAVILSVGIGATDAALSSSGRETAIDDESWTPDAGNVTELDESNIANARYSDTVTVTRNSKEMTDGVDYEWYADNGTVKALEGGDLDGVSSASIDYAFTLPTDQQQDIASLFGGSFEIGGVLVFVLGVVVILAAVRAAA